MTRRTAVLSAALLFWVGCTDNRTTPVVGLLADNTNLSLNSGNTTLKVGQTQQLSIIHTHNGLTYTGTAVWQSSTPAVATVDMTGLVTAVAPGTASITATNASGEQDDGSVTITVIPNVLTVTGLTWATLFGTEIITGGSISGAPPRSPVSMWDPATPLFTWGGTVGASQLTNSGCTMVADANGNVTIPLNISVELLGITGNCSSGGGGVPAGVARPGDAVYFCPNDWGPLGDGTAQNFFVPQPGSPFFTFIADLNTPGFAASQGCAGPFIAG